MYKIQITKFFNNKDSLLNFIGCFLEGKTLAFFPEEQGWTLIYETGRDVFVGELNTGETGDVEIIETT